MEMNSCPFCMESIADETFAESQYFRAIYNISPILPGHSLVIPKRHVSSFLELTDGEACEMTLFSREIAAKLVEVFSSSGFNWTIQEGAVAGQRQVVTR